MMDNHHLRGIILKLENRLSDDDRKRLHFLLGNDVPRRIRDDPSLGGTLSLIQSLVDQDKINEQDFTFLIHAFDEIQCADAVQILTEHMRRMQSNILHESIQSLASIMPFSVEQSFENQEEDKYPAIGSPLINKQYVSNNNIEMIDINPVIPISDESSLQSNQKEILNKSSIKLKCLLLFIFLVLLIIGLTVLTSVIIIHCDQLNEDLKIKKNQLINLQITNNQTIQELNNQLQQSFNKQNTTIQELNNQLKQLQDEQLENNQTNQRLNKQLQESFNEQLRLNETIQNLTNHYQPLLSTAIDSTTISTIVESTQKTTKNPIYVIGSNNCGCPNSSLCQDNCITRFGATKGRCSGFFSSTCQCYIEDVWKSKEGQC